jgi:hypothetical protein
MGILVHVRTKMSKNSLYVPKNTSGNSLVTIIEQTISSGESLPANVVLSDSTQTISGVKSFASGNFKLVNGSGIATLTNTAGINRTYNFSAGSGSTQTIATNDNTLTLTNKTVIAPASVSSQNLTFADDSVPPNRFQFQSDSVGAPAGSLNYIKYRFSATNGITNTLSFENSTSDNLYSFPDLGGTICTIDAAQTLTNKTLTSPTIDSGNITITSGRLLSTALGSAASPAFAIGASLNDGIYSSAAGSINIATAGVLRATFGSSSITLASGIGITGSGSSTFTAGSGGHVGTGPLSSSLTSSATTNSVRPTNQANTGINGTAATNLNMAVGGTNIVALTTTGAAVTGTLSATGVTTATGGLRIGANGTTISTLVRGSTTYATALAANGYVNIGATSFGITFASTPNVICTLQPQAGSNFWDQCQVSAISVSTTSVNFALKNNNTANATNGTVQINYMAWI